MKWKYTKGKDKMNNNNCGYALITTIGGIIASILIIMQLLFFSQHSITDNIVKGIVTCCIVFICHFVICTYKCVFEKLDVYKE